MAKPHKVDRLVLEPRTEIGTTGARHARLAGKVPGVVYGHGSSTPIAIDAKQLADLILGGARSKIIEASIGGTNDSVLLRRIEADPISRKPLSVDFQRVSKDEAVSATVHVVTTGTPVGVTQNGGVMDVVTHSLDIKGPASALPDHLTVDVGPLDIHQHVTAAQVELPKGFTLLTPPDTIVVSVEVTRAIASETPEEAPAVEGAAPAAAAEPAS
ncbi:MAG TPA: 50S ribosomal protein L25 [Candidatus Elarobacter sp.]|jgi:large subunit ribosomal protein L25